MVSNALAGFATGFLGTLAKDSETKQKKQDEIDLIYQRELAKVSPETAIRSAVERVQGEETRKTEAARKADPIGDQLRSVIGVGKVATPGAQEQDTQMPMNTPADMNDDNTPIQPQTSPISAPNVSQAPGAVPPLTADTPAGVAVAPAPGLEASPAISPEGQDQSGNPVEAEPVAMITTPDVQPTYTPLEKLPENIRPLFAAIKDPDLREAAIMSRATPGVDPEKWMSSTYFEFMKQDAAREKANPLTESDIGPKDAIDFKARKSLGLITNIPDKRLDFRQQGKVDSLYKDAATAYAGASQSINNYNSILGLSEDVINGPYADMEAKVRAGFAQMTRQQTSDAVNSLYVTNKNTVQLANAQVKALGGSVRPGIGMLKFEKESVPNPNMPKEAMVELALQGLMTAKGIANHATALMSGPSDVINVGDRTKLAKEYDEANPVLLGDGVTPNPDYLEFNDWLYQVANDEYSPKTTAKDIRAAGGKVKPKDEEPAAKKDEKAGWSIKKLN